MSERFFRALSESTDYRQWSRFDIEVEKASTASTSLSRRLDSFPATDQRARLIDSSFTDPSITFDLRTTLDDIARDLPWAGMKPRTPKKLLNGFDSLDATPDISRATSPAPFATNGSSSSPGAEQLEVVKRWLSCLVPFGVDADCDETLEQLDVRPSPVDLALATQQYVYTFVILTCSSTDIVSLCNRVDLDLLPFLCSQPRKQHGRFPLIQQPNVSSSSPVFFESFSTTLRRNELRAKPSSSLLLVSKTRLATGSNDRVSQCLRIIGSTRIVSPTLFLPPCDFSC